MWKAYEIKISVAINKALLVQSLHPSLRIESTAAFTPHRKAEDETWVVRTGTARSTMAPPPHLQRLSLYLSCGFCHLLLSISILWVWLLLLTNLHVTY